MSVLSYKILVLFDGPIFSPSTGRSAMDDRPTLYNVFSMLTK